MILNQKQHHTKEELRRARRNLLLIIIAVTAACFLLPSCTTTKYVPVVEKHDEHHWHTDSVIQKDSTYHEKETTIMQLDSAEMARYGIRLKQAERAWLVRTNELQRQIERLEAMSVSKDSVHDSIPVPYPVEVIREVPAELTWWQQTRMDIGGWAIVALSILLGILLRSGWLKIRRRRDL